jgi:hypothetical protein
VSEPEDLELEALQRQLDDAFDTTRPRAGFEDELWTRMQARRPAGTRLRDAWLGLLQGIREAPAVPIAAVAAVLVVVIGAGALLSSGVGHFGGAGSTATSNQEAPQAGALVAAGAFGRLPSPALASSVRSPSGAQSAPAANADYSGPVALTWTGTLTLNMGSAPVFRYHEPSTNTADQFATSLGAILVSRPAPYLGAYETTDFSVRVRGTVQTPAGEPTFIMLPIVSIPGVDTTGGPADAALVFLAEHSLAPSWQYTSGAVVDNDVTRVTLYRQFGVTGYGYAYLVNGSGERYGMEIDLKSNRPTSVTGPLPVTIESAPYPIISADEAVRSALASGPATGASAVPTATLTSAELVYSLVVAGDHSFYEPSILFSGTFTANGTTHVKRVLVPAVDPNYRSS